ncbi:MULTISPECIES: DNA primase [Holospora]|uniref:DNA primase n=2 Tax=Holospora TaxID=44747 RepID=A0A061JII8_9PROT|nr:MULTISPECIES: DNA primase [Holospora]ETZ05398.1 DNA primase [Holospora undulata HU1]GAJ45842.1 DNA primase [Holospora elegans E1]
MDISIYSQIRHRISIVDLVSGYIKLQKKGNNWSALCPFHKEKSPSFVVQEVKGSYHCFGCGAHGDVIDFLKNIEGITTIEAIQKLAEQANIQSWKNQYSYIKPQDTDLKECLMHVCEYFIEALKNQEFAKNYLGNRGISFSCQEHFKLGWCDALVMQTIKSHISSDTLIKAGLITDQYHRNFFEGRITFPIFNARGEILGFGGRSLQEQKMPKYLNSPETSLFIKHQILYGIENLKSNLPCVVVEGYLDALAFWKRMPAVACLGTALSAEHLHMIWKVTPEPVICFDGDAAGKTGAYKAICTALPLLTPGNTLRIAELPLGQDPQSIIHYQGWDVMEKIIKDAAPLSEVLYHHIFSQEVLLVPERRAKAVLLWKQQTEIIKNSEVKRAYQSFFKERFYGKRFSSQKNKTAPCSVSLVLGIEILLGALCIFPGLLGQVQEILAQLYCPQVYVPLKEALIQWQALQENSFDSCHHPPTLLDCSDASWYKDLVQRVTPHLAFWQNLDLNTLQAQWIELFNAHQTQYHLEDMRDRLKDQSHLLFSEWEELKLLTFKDELI